jgi:plasmid stabilization system protein ParE
MAKVILTRRASEQLVAFRAFHAETEPVVGDRAMAAILVALRRLESHPAAGRPHPEAPELRELVIPFGRSGYIALYRVDGQRLVVLAIRHQREAGYDNDHGST